jgi:hypothetical protein
MKEDDRTVEMFVPAEGPIPPPPTAGQGGAVAPATNRDDPRGSTVARPPTPAPYVPGAGAPRGAYELAPAANAPVIPESIGRQRASPALDPISRMRVSRLAKWGMLVSIVLFFLWLPLSFGQNPPSDDKSGFYFALAASSTIFAAILATALPRIVAPGIFGRWHEPVEAMRDWLLVGVATGFFYFGLIQVLIVIPLGPPEAANLPEWLEWRLPIIFIGSMLAVGGAQRLAIRREGLMPSGAQAVLQILVQGLLIAVLERPIEAGFREVAKFCPAPVAIFLAVVAALLAAAAIGTIFWSATVDEALSSVKKRGSTGVVDGSKAVDLTLTVVGGRESGKTVLLAAAFYEWSTQNLGNLRITPAAETEDPEMGTVNLEDVARELYINYQFPVGTVSSQNLPFDLSLGQDKVARFTFLDYPGGAIAGRVADSRVVQAFWDRVDDTDGLILIADMSYVRRNRKDSDWLEVRNAYRTVMQRLVDRNGKRRVVPVALVLTKCDEFVDPATGLIDMAQLEAGIREFQYDELETEWRKMNAERGPGVAEFTTWITSAITYSQPQKGPDGRPDYRRPFMIAPPPPSVTPTGCASPLLWMTSKVMRWNVTLFADLGTFLFGSSPAIRRRVDAVLEMERVAEERAAKA